MGRGQLPNSFEGEQTALYGRIVGIELALYHFAGAVEDGEHYGTRIEQPEVVAGEQKWRSQAPGEPPYVFASVNDDVGAGPLEADVVAHGFRNDAGAPYPLIGLGKTADQ